MRNGLEEVVLGQQALRNLHFLIQLQLQTMSVIQDGTLEAVEAQTVLKRLLETEERVRTGLPMAAQAYEAKSAMA